MKMKFIIWLVLLLSSIFGQAATKVFMHDATSTYNTSYRDSSTFIGASDVTGVTNSALGPTSGIQMTKTAGGSALTWISPKLTTAVTISGTVTFNGWALESATACNCGLEVQIIKFTGGAEGATVVDSEFGTELTASNVVQNWTATPTSTTFAIGDQIVVKWLINDAGGTMASGRTVTFHYDGASAGSSGDSWVQFNETVQFQTSFVNGGWCSVNTASTCTTTTWATQDPRDMVACGVASFSENVTQVKDSLNNVFTLKQGTSTPGQSSGGNYIAYLPNIGTTSATYSVSVTGSAAQFVTLVCEEFHNDVNIFITDASITGTNGSGTNISVSLPGVTSGALVFAMSSIDTSTAPTAGSGYVIPPNGVKGLTGQAVAVEYKFNAPAGSNTANFTVASGGAAVNVLSFKYTSCTATDCVVPTDTFTEKDTITHTGTATAVTYTWTNPATTNPPVSILAWNNFAPFDIRDKKLVYFAGNDVTGGSPIYANSMYLYDAKLKVFNQLYTSAQNTSTCTTDTSSNPENRHVYNQQAWNSTNNSWYFTSGSCSGGLGYDMYSLAPNTANTSATVTQLSNPATNPGVRQEAIMTFVPAASNGTGHDAFIIGFASGSGGNNDTWIYDISTNTYTQICFASSTAGSPTCSASNHDGAGIILDSWSAKIIIFGGLTGASGSSSCTSNCDWQMDPTNITGDSWTQMTPTTQLPAAGYTCYGYDTNRDRLLVLTNNGQLWQWQYWNYTWEQLSGATGGPTLSANPQNYGCGFDSANDIFVMFSGDAATTGKGVWQIPFNFDGIARPASCNLMMTGVC